MGAKGKWITVWPPPAEVTEAKHFLIIESEEACAECRLYFGWVMHRSYDGKRLDYGAFGTERWVLGYWNEDRSMFTVLGRFTHEGTAEKAWDHLVRTQVRQAGVDKESA